MRAFEFFGGVPKTVLLDNLKAGVVRPDLYDPTINRAYAELERHYGFVADPAKVATPGTRARWNARCRWCASGRSPGAAMSIWPISTRRRFVVPRAGRARDPRHDLQAPMTRFEQLEQPALLPLPAQPFDPPTWAEARVHPIITWSLIAATTRCAADPLRRQEGVGQSMTRRLVEIYCDDVLAKTHPRATRRGTWVTDPNDYPQAAKAFSLRTRPIAARRPRNSVPMWPA
ncbi:hypothetical protein [Geoalkalibacter halelectricus]|uniref:hypothetical protein n=1 Tax=Geoalkalibacter halelectricus TaxID=2847045 RepID=UPI002670AC8A|nr:hypothetical protein [Geoalkalibacter halelectricus]MDO3380315.1 hypothetical protein [Geoalkalibacter halelectricus]